MLQVKSAMQIFGSKMTYQIKQGHNTSGNLLCWVWHVLHRRQSIVVGSPVRPWACLILLSANHWITFCHMGRDRHNLLLQQWQGSQTMHMFTIWHNLQNYITMLKVTRCKLVHKPIQIHSKIRKIKNLSKSIRKTWIDLLKSSTTFFTSHSSNIGSRSTRASRSVSSPKQTHRSARADWTLSKMWSIRMWGHWVTIAEILACGSISLKATCTKEYTSSQLGSSPAYVSSKVTQINPNKSAVQTTRSIFCDKKQWTATLR